MGTSDFWLIGILSKFEDADFSESRFNSYADFSYSKFNNADFSKSHFNSDVIFRNVKLYNNLFFSNSKFKDIFFEGSSLNMLYLDQAEYDNRYIKFHNIAGLNYDEIAYLRLIKNFNNLGFLMMPTNVTMNIV